MLCPVSVLRQVNSMKLFGHRLIHSVIAATAVHQRVFETYEKPTKNTVVIAIGSAATMNGFAQFRMIVSGNVNELLRITLIIAEI